MSRETAQHLNTQVLVGCTAKRGNAWHYRADLQTPWSFEYEDEQGRRIADMGVGNHYDGFVPVSHVIGRLFNWEPITAPVFAQIDRLDGTKEFVEISNTQRIYPSDDPSYTFWISTESYLPHSYEDWLVGGISNILDTAHGDLGISSAGLLNGRATAWVEVSMPDTVITPEGIAFRPNLLAATSLNGTVATTYKRTVTATVCDNTLSAALSEKTSQTVKVRHSRYSNLKLADAREALAIIHTMADEVSAELAELCAIEVTDKQFFDIVNAVLLPDGKEPETKNGKTIIEKRREEMSQLWRNDNRVSPWAGTGFGVIQAFNTHTQHFKGARRGVSKADRNMMATIKGDIEEQDRKVYATMLSVLDNA